ncbi:MAG: biopolymer transporter ExbD [Polyangia bacterium]
MAGGMSVPTKGGRKALDAAINLVPFIDLLSCCISFLLITAVWTQLASLPVSRGGGGGEAGDPPEVQLTLEVRGDGFLLRKSTGEQLPVSAPAGGAGFVELAALLKQVKEQHPRTDDITVQADDRVPYERVIRTLDTLRGARFPAIRVSDR